MKKTEITVGKKTYALTENQAWALMNAEYEFTFNGLYTKQEGRRERPYVRRAHARVRRSLFEMGLTEDGWWWSAVTPTGRRVARKLWPIFNDESIEDIAARINAEHEREEAERKENLRTAVQAFTGIKDAEGRSMRTRIHKEAARGRWNDRVDLSLEDLAVIGEQIGDRLAAAHERVEAHK